MRPGLGFGFDLGVSFGGCGLRFALSGCCWERGLLSKQRRLCGSRELFCSAAVSREEVYANIADGAKLHRHYLTLVVLAAIVAGVGLTYDNTAAVIGAMVVAPLLGPNMAIALGIVLGDLPLVRRALVAAGAGFALTLVFAVFLGLALGADPTTPELAARARVGIWDLVLALAAGCAGALAFTSGAPTYLTGVMVAVALLPPTVASGMLFSSGNWVGAANALLLAASNVTAITLAAILTFAWRGMRPRNWWLAERARSLPSAVPRSGFCLRSKAAVDPVRQPPRGHARGRHGHAVV